MPAQAPSIRHQTPCENARLHPHPSTPGLTEVRPVGDWQAREEAARVERTPPSRLREFLAFLLLAVLIWPFIAVGVVAGWGFLVWMYYAFTGPPGPV